MIRLSSDILEFAIDRKIDRLIARRDDKAFIKSKLVSLKELEENWIKAEDTYWQDNIVMFYSVFSSRPIKVGDRTLNSDGRHHYHFTCLASVNASTNHTISFIKHEYKKFLWVKKYRHTINLMPSAFKFRKLVDVSSTQEGLELDFNKDLLTADYRTDEGVGLLAPKNCFNIGWSLYKI